MTRLLEVVEAGLVSYGEALEWQRELAEDRIAGRLSHDVLLLLEHPPVVTLGRTSQAPHLLRPARLEQMRGFRMPSERHGATGVVQQTHHARQAGRNAILGKATPPAQPFRVR